MEELYRDLDEELEAIEEEIVEEVIEEEISEPEESSFHFGKVINGSLNLRAEPSKEAAIVKVLPNGTQVNYKLDKEEINGFVKVRVEEFDAEGFVMSEFIEWE